MKIPFTSKQKPVVSVLRLDGVIDASSKTNRGLSLSETAADIEKAFETKGAVAVALVINSPGGSPVQSHAIHDRIRALADEEGLPVYAFVEDVAASGGYILALAGDEIYANASSIVGSIGVISSGFGFVSLIEKLGVERRTYATGDHKAMLDPFKPEDDGDIKRLLAIQGQLHEEFVALVRGRRGAKLLADEETPLFTGEFWAGRKALRLGLIDGISDIRTKMREEFGDEVELKVATSRKWLPWSKRSVEVGLAGGIVNAIEGRAAWSRFGL